jgi:hypothetical protein
VDPKSFNTANPLVTDTVVTYPTEYGFPRDTPATATYSSADAHKPCGWVAVRFVADNPGMWMMHCHIDWHMTLGMALVFDVDSASLRNTTLPTDTALCGAVKSFATVKTTTTATSSTSTGDSSTSSERRRYLILVTVIPIVGGLLVLGGLVAFLAYFFTANKAKKAPSTNNGGVEVEEDGRSHL